MAAEVPGQRNMQGVGDLDREICRGYVDSIAVSLFTNRETAMLSRGRRPGHKVLLLLNCCIWNDLVGRYQACYQTEV